ncbi:MAG: hypothetical protein RM338_17960 [Nostoc sp. DedQUE12a]|nr:hypothetical protein [Nostoc sp. DedQUE12a]
MRELNITCLEGFHAKLTPMSLAIVLLKTQNAMSDDKAFLYERLRQRANA